MSNNNTESKLTRQALIMGFQIFVRPGTGVPEHVRAGRNAAVLILATPKGREGQAIAR